MTDDGRAQDIRARKRELLRKRLAEAGLSPAGDAIKPRPAGASAPLSAAQRRMWLLQELEPDSAAYNICAAVGLSGALDTDAFLAAATAACARHEILRTVYPDADTQVVRPDCAPIPRLLEPAGQREQVLRDVAVDLGGQPFDLARESPLRLWLLRFAPDDHVLLLVAHHIAWDDASWEILLRDIAAGYTGAVPAAPAVQYADYAAWEQGREHTEELDFWTKRLTPVPEPLPLPADRPRPAKPTDNGGRTRRVLPAAIAAQVRDSARDEGVTPFMVLAAATTAVLHRYTGATDIPLGTPVVNRTREETSGLIGNFGNTVVLRSTVDGERGFRTLLAQVREVCSGAYANTELPFDRLVTALAPERTAGRSVLFDVLFSLRTDVARGFELPGVAPAEVSVFNGTAQFDLALATVLGDDLLLEATYRTELFDSETVETLLRHTERLLRAVLADPDLPLSQVDLLGDEERERILRQWNDTTVEIPATTLPELLAKQVESTPDATALVFEQKRLSYAEFDRSTNRLAAVLRAAGVGPERTVALVLPRSVELVVAIWAVLKAGGAYLPVDPDYPAERIDYMITDAEPATVLTVSATADRVPDGITPLLLDDPATEAGYPDTPPGARPHPLNPAYVIYTSGSTGRPKGVVVPHAGIVNRLLWMQDTYGLEPGEPVLQKTPSSFDVSVWEFCWPLLTGAALVVARPDGHRDPAYLAELIQVEGVTTVHFVPSMLRAFLADPAAAGCTGLRRVLCSGEALPADLADSFHELLPTVGLHNLYGPTEASVDVTSLASAGRPATPTVPIGRPVWNTAMYVLDRTLAPVPVGVPGELYIAGVQLARAYLGRPGLSAERFVADPFGRPGSRMYRTGDIARFDRDGVLEYLGRADDQVKLRGLRIELGEIEAVLAAHPDVRGAAVAVRGNRLVGYLVGGDHDSVREHAAETLPEYMVPAAFRTVDQLPLSPSGKLDRKKLATAAEYAPVSATSRAPRTDRERRLCALFAEVLRVPEVGADERFFTAGGDSIQAISLVGRARAAGLEFTPRDVFEHQTPAGLAAVARESAVTAHAEDGIGLVPATPIMEWLRGRGDAVGRFSQTVVVEVPAGLDPDTLTGALQAVVDHHDVLRARLARWTDGPWQLDIAPVGQVDAATLLRRAETLDEHPEDELDPDAGAVLRVRWLEAGRLQCTAHHLVIDGVSWRILLADLAQAYEALAAGNKPELAPVPVSLRGHARRLADRAVTAAEHLPRWQSVLDQREEFPMLRPLDPAKDTAATTRRLHHTLDATPLLTEVPAVFRTGVDDVLLAALVIAVADWRAKGPQGHLWGAQRPKGGLEGTLTVDLEGHGRDGSGELSRTVGWFTSLYPVRLDPGAIDVEDALAGGGAAGQVLRRVKEQLAALGDDAAEFGLLRYLNSATASVLAEYPAPAIGFNYLGRFDSAAGRWELAREDGALRSGIDDGLAVAHCLEIEADVRGSQLSVTWAWPDGVLAESAVADLADTWLRALGALVAHAARGTAELTPSDVPLAGVDQDTIDALTAELPGAADILPLSPLAEGLLYHAQSAGEDVYIVQFAVDLEGEVDPERLRRAADELLRRHPNLRSTFRTGPDGRAFAVVVDDVPAPLRVVEVSDVERAERERPFNLESAPLLRFVLAKTGPRTHRLVFTCHHLLLDGWSTILLLRELLTLYGEGDAPAPPPYRDYLAWLATQNTDTAAWKVALSDVDAPTLLGNDGPPSSVTVDLPDAEALAELCKRRGWTMNTFVQGVWGLLLSALTGRTDVVFGTAVAGRPPELPGVENMIGLFTNTVPVRVALRPQETIAELFDRLQRAQAELLEHQHLGLAVIQRAAGHDVLFDSLVVFENYPLDPDTLASPGLTVTGLSGHDATHYPVRLTVIPAEHGLTLRIDTTGQPVVEHLLELFALLAKDVDRPVRTVNLAGEAAGGRCVLDPFQRPVLPGVIGDVYVDGRRTGSRASMDTEGVLTPARGVETITIRGVRVRPAQIEAVLTAHPDVRAAVVVARDGALVSYVDAGDPVRLREFLATVLPAHQIPSVFVVHPELARQSLDWLDPDTLPAPGGTAAPGYRAPRDPREQILCELFADVLGTSVVGIDDDFFALGGHSLLATRLVARVRSVLGAELPIATLFAARTPSRVAEALGVAGPTRAAVTSRERPETLPLSFAQQRLWFLHQLEGPSPTYNIANAWRLSGPLDESALRAALTDVVARHEPLRTVFPMVDGVASQHVRDAADIGLEVRDTTERTLSEDLTAASRHSFVLATETPLRATLLRLAGEEHVLLLVLHHIAGDGWSFAPLMRDLGRAYAARLRGESPEWTPLPVSYADYVLWQRELLDGDLARQAGYWRTALAGIPAELDLPADRPRPEEATYAGGLVEFPIDAELAAGVRSAAMSLGVSPFMVWQAALAALLTRLGAGTDIPIGTPIAGRTDGGLDDVVGLFVNTLVLRTDTAGEPTMRELASRVRRVALDAYEHQDLPFEKLVEIVNPPRSVARHPLFQVMLAYQNNALAQAELPDLTVRQEVVDTRRSSFDLTFTIVDDDGMAGFVEYSADLFDRSTVETIADGLTRLLQAAVSNLDAPLGELGQIVDFLPRPQSGGGVLERQKVDYSPNATGAEILREVFAEVLGRAEVGAEEGFFELGGDSISSIQMISRARAAGLLLSPKDVFRHQTPAALAAVASPISTGEAEPAGAALGTVPETPIMAWLRERNGPVDRFSQALVIHVPDTGAQRLELALQAVLDRHDALRARLVRGEEWTLEIGPPGSVQAHTCLRRVPADADPRAQIGMEAAQAQAALDPEAGRMVQAVWLDPGLLVLVIHHLVIDGVSWRVLLQDLRAAWETGVVASPPGTSLRGWAGRLRAEADRPGTLAELPLWHHAEPPKLPLDRELDPARDTAATLQELRLTLPAQELHDVPSAFHAGMDDVLLAGLALAMRDWTGAPDVLVELEGHGRESEDVDLSATVGWFTSVYPVRLDPGSVDGAVKAVKEQLRQVPRGGLGYGLLRYLNPATAQELSGHRPQILFNYLGRFTIDGALWTVSELTETVPRGADPGLPVQYPIEINAVTYDRPGGPELVVTWSWPDGVLSGETVRALAESWFGYLRGIAERPAGGHTPSDLSLVSLSQDEIDEFEAEWSNVD